MKTRTFVASLFAILVLSLTLPGQEFRSTISGMVTDSTGASIPGAKVIAREVRTGTKLESTTETSGQYTFAALLPGDYEVTVQATGFKAFLRSGLHIGSGDHAVIDIKMEVGDVATTVEVKADAPLLHSENGTLGQSITTKEVEDLPSNGGTPMLLASLSLGVIATAQPGTVQPFASGGGASWSIGGQPSQTNELLVDGSPNTTWDGRMAYSGLKDAVREVVIKTFDTDASGGHTGAGSINQIMKSGTNQVHGTAYEYNQPNTLTANNFFSNKSGLATPVTHFNQYGVTAGGPLWIPKVFNGQNKVFWFFGFEGVRDSTPATAIMSVPTLAERNGDFSALLNTKGLAPIQLYDPATAVKSGSNVVRSPFPNNIIPTARLDKIALNYLSFFPKPNDPSGLLRNDGTQNYASNAPSIDGYTNELGRLDWNETQNNRTYFNIRHTDYFQIKNDYFSNVSTGSDLSRSNWGLALDHVYTVNDRNIINMRVNFSRMFEDHRAPSAGIDPGTLGFPSYLAANAQSLQMPVISFATSPGLTTLGQNTANTLPSQSLQAFGTWTAVRGNHSLKIGADLRQYRFNYASVGNATGTMSFSANTWTRQASNASSTVATGQDLSEFLLGLPTSAQFDVNATAMFYEYYAAGFVQDDWRIRRNLTLNLGLRIDHDFPWREKWGRTVNGFDSTSANPMQAAAQAAYAKGPSALLPASQFNVLGGLTFASPDNNAVFSNTSHLVSPRFGFAWSPEKLPGTVVRGGVGMFVSSISLATLQPTGAYSTNPLLTQEGFSQSTTLPSNNTNDNGITAIGTLANPFPNGIQRPVGSAGGLATFNGQGVNFLNPDAKSPYSVRWNLAIEHTFGSNTVVELVYTGNHAVHLPVTYTQLNSIPSQYLTTSPIRDQTTITKLTATTANPFLGLAQTTANTATTVAVNQILARFPQFPVGFSSGQLAGSTGVVVNDLNVGSSYFAALGMGVKKRLSSGLQLQANYQWSKASERIDWLNASDAQPEKRISAFDRPHRITFSSVYELPFGKGKKFATSLPGWANHIVGGWKITGVYQWQIGGPIPWLNGSTNNPGDYIYLGGPLNLNSRNVDTTSFDTSVFLPAAAYADANQVGTTCKATPSAANCAPQYHIRTFATAFGNLRSDGINQIDASILKNFQLRESLRVEFRLEGFNVVNHALFAAPNTQASNAAFGTITTQANRPRILQLGARIVF